MHRDPRPERSTGSPRRRSVVDKFNQRRDELADAALETLLDRGYANTSLRDIATQSEFSHGVLHYYFEDKLDLIVYCADFYEHRLAQVIPRLEPDGPDTPETIVEALVASLSHAIAEESALHRLWNDFRSQSMFEGRLRESVDRVEAGRCQALREIAERYAAIAGFRLVVDADAAYALMDGVFQTCLRRSVSGEERALEALPGMVEALMAMLVGQVPAVALPEDTFDDLVR